MERIIMIEKAMIIILNMLFCLDSALLAVFLGVFFFCMADFFLRCLFYHARMLSSKRSAMVLVRQHRAADKKSVRPRVF